MHGAPKAADRRREPRVRAGKAAQYMLINYPERGWGRCKVADVSRHGAGLVLFGPPWPRYRSEMRLLIKLEADADEPTPSPPSLEVIVRNAGATREGWLRVGVEFVALSAEQHVAATEWMQHLHANNA